MNRRSILKMLGAGPAAIAAQAERATGLSGGLASALGFSPVAPCLYDSIQPVDTDGPDRIGAYLAAHAIPDFVMDRVRENAANVQRLDPDLAVNRSFSLGTKLRIQTEREVARAVRTTRETAKRSIIRAAFRKLHGFEIW